MKSNDSDEFLTTALLCQRYKKSSKTIDRWTKQGLLPQPQRINGRRHWRRSKLEQHERESLSLRALKPDNAP